MLKKTKLILLFMLVFSLALLLGNTQLGAENYQMTGVTAGNMEGKLEGGNMVEACIRVSEELCVPMVALKNFYICDGDAEVPEEPDVSPGENCYKMTSLSLCAGEGDWWDFGSTLILWTCNPSTLIECGDCLYCP